MWMPRACAPSAGLCMACAICATECSSSSWFITKCVLGRKAVMPCVARYLGSLQGAAGGDVEPARAVDVGIDQPRDDPAAARIDDLRVGGKPYLAFHSGVGNALVLDENNPVIIMFERSKNFGMPDQRFHFLHDILFFIIIAKT